MKKKLFLIVSVFCFGLAGFIYSLTQKQDVSPLLLANIEALAQGEGVTGNCGFYC